MRFSGLVALVVSLPLALAGCGSEPADTPSECLGGRAAILRILDRPPDPASTGFATPGSCLVSSQPAGELANAGGAMVAAAQTLNAQGHRDPGGVAPIRLGYLLGSVRSRAAETGGIHDNLAERIEAAVLYSPGGRPLPPAFERGLTTGEREAERAG